MPRLDWQMWFAALAPPRRSPWLAALLERLLEGSRPVADLFAENPFPERPPRLVRAVQFRYRFTTPNERVVSGDWWSREEIGLFVPPRGKQ
jgi:hypothetical protein